MENMKTSFNYLGYGIGLRAEYYNQILEEKPAVDWFEIMTEDYLDPKSRASYFLEKTLEHYPVVMHGVSMSIGSTDPLDFDYLKQVKALSDRVSACWLSDHLCWTGVDNVNLHDLLPVPYTEEMLNHVAERVLQVQDYLKQPLVLENPSSYLTFDQDQMSEWEFLVRLIKKTDCRLLLDVNNVFVSAFNHKFDPQEYLSAIPKEAVQQFHLAGHTNRGTHIIDTHDEEIIDEVWELYADAVKLFGRVSTLIERDDNMPPLKDLLAELEQARKIGEDCLVEG